METMISVLLCIFSAIIGVILGCYYNLFIDWLNWKSQQKSPNDEFKKWEEWKEELINKKKGE